MKQATAIEAAITLACHGGSYHAFVASRFKDMGSKTDNLLHATVGLAGEGGEALDAAKKHWAYGKELDEENLKEELGDAIFYIVAACNLMGWTLAEVMEANVVKLSKRYPQGVYSNEQAIARADKQGFA